MFITAIVRIYYDIHDFNSYCSFFLMSMSFCISWIELCKSGLRDSLQHLLGEDSQKLPADVQSFLDRSVLIMTLQLKTNVERLVYGYERSQYMDEQGYTTLIQRSRPPHRKAYHFLPCQTLPPQLHYSVTDRWLDLVLSLERIPDEPTTTHIQR